jgi:hypothetical protein
MTEKYAATAANPIAAVNVRTRNYGSFGSGGVLFGSLRSPLACSNA